MKTPIINAGISMVLHYIFLIVSLIVFKPNLYVVVIADIIFGLVVCILNAISIYRYIGYRQEIVKTFLLPLISAAIMAIFTFCSYKVFYLLTEINAISCMIAIFVAIIVYGITLLLLRGIEEEEILMLPKGRSILNLLQKLRLF